MGMFITLTPPALVMAWLLGRDLSILDLIASSEIKFQPLETKPDL